MRSIGLRQQLLLFALLPLFVVCAGTGLFVLYSYHTEVEILQERQALRTARMLARLAAPALITDDRGKLQELLDSAIDQNICGAQLLSTDYTPIISSGKLEPHEANQASLRWHGGGLSARHPVYRYSHTNLPPTSDIAPPMLGWIIVHSDQKSLTQYRYETITASLLWILIALLGVSFLGGNISKILKRRMTQLRTTISSLDSHDWSTRLPQSDNPDWQSLSSALNDLAQRTQQRLRLMQNQIEHSDHDLQNTLESLEISNIELELARKEAVSASQSKSDFLANTSHEVRTPLTGILGFCKVLLQSETHPRKRDYLETIQRSAEHLLGILNDVLDLSKIEAGKFSLDHKPYNLLRVVEESVCLFSHQAADKGIELIIEAIEPLPAEVCGDGARLKQLIANLVSNAVKFTEHGQVLVRMSVKKLDGLLSELSLEVADTGIGIEAKEQSQLFKAFQQLDSSTTRAQGGTGLGLAIVRNLLIQMHGAIDLDSSYREGTRFRISLPLEVVQNSRDRYQEATLYKTALLWERNPDSRRALTHRLQKHGIVVTHIETLDELTHLMPLRPDCKLLLSLRDESELTTIEPVLPPSRTSILLPTLRNVLTRSDHDFVQKPVTESQLIAQFRSPNIVRDTLDTRPVLAQTMASTLIVDDNANNRLLLKVLLDHSGAPGKLCSSGADAVSCCSSHHYPLILLDLQMPGMDGAEVAAAIRRSALNAHSHIVAMTAHGSCDSVPPEQLIHFDDFLAKPINLDTLQKLLRFCRPDSSHTLHPDELKPININDCLHKSEQRPELALQLLAKFIDGLPECESQWRTATTQRDIDSIRSLAHQLQGACAYVGAPPLSMALTKLQASLHESGSWNDALATSAHTVISEIRKLIHWDEEHEIAVMFEGGAAMTPI